MVSSKSAISVIMPCFNEAAAIEKNAGEMERYLKTLGRPYQLILVDDGSTDSTPRILDSMRSSTITVAHHYRNRGRGAALRTGFDAATGSYVFTFDADLSYSPDHIKSMLAELERGADVVLAAAYHAQGRVENVPFFRAWISRMGNRVLTIGRPLTTVTCVVRGYRKEVVDSLALFSEGKDIHLEILSKAEDLGYRVVEVPARLKWRATKMVAGQSGARRSTFKLFAHVTSHLQFLFTDAPFVLLGATAAALIIAGLGIGIFIISEWLKHQLVPDRPIITLMVIVLLAGLQTLLFSLLASQNRSSRRELVRTQALIRRSK